MQTANILLALAGDSGNTVPKYGVTPAEIAVLRLIHGEEAVFDVEPAEDVDRGNREELSRLRLTYGRARVEDGSGDRKSAVEILFPGAAARVFQSLAELDIPEDFYKAEKRAKPKAEDPLPSETSPGVDGMTKAELVAFADDNDIEIDASAKKADILAAIKGAAAETPAPPAQDDDGVQDMPDQSIFG